MGEKLREAMEFLVEHLLEKEKATSEMQCLSEIRGINEGTLKRARRIMQVKA